MRIKKIINWGYCLAVSPNYSDQLLISPYTISTTTSRKVMRITALARLQQVP